jgi:hypothetical protein
MRVINIDKSVLDMLSAQQTEDFDDHGFSREESA